MNDDMTLEQIRFLQVIQSHLNRFYIWGGDDPEGFDCSGMVIDGLQAIGRFPVHLDATADGLWHRFKSAEVNLRARPGSLLFWFNNKGKAIHVAVALDKEYCITADGGGSRVKTIEDAKKYNAYVKIRRIDHRKAFPRILDIFQ